MVTVVDSAMEGEATIIEGEAMEVVMEGEAVTEETEGAEGMVAVDVNVFLFSRLTHLSSYL